MQVRQHLGHQSARPAERPRARGHSGFDQAQWRVLEGHPLHPTGPKHQHAVPERAGKVAKTTVHYYQTVRRMTNKKNLPPELDVQHQCMALYPALNQTLAAVQMRKRLDTYANLVHGFSMPGLKTRHDNIDIVVIR